MKSVIIVTSFLLLTITNLASSQDVDYEVYEVVVTIYHPPTHPVPLQGYSYPSSLTARKNCGLEIYTVTPRDTHCIQLPRPPSGNCTYVYFEDTCPTGLILLAEGAKINGREAVIYRTQHINETLRTLIRANVSIPVILVKDPKYIIRQYQYEYFRYVNVTLVSQTSLPPPRPYIPSNNEADHQNRNTTTVFIVGSVFAALLLVGILVLTLAIFVYYKRHRQRTRRVMHNGTDIIRMTQMKDLVTIKEDSTEENGVHSEDDGDLLVDNAK